MAETASESGRARAPMLSVIDRWLWTAFGPGSGHGLGYLGAATIAVALTLRLLGSLLYVPSGWGIEDFLAWTDVGSGGPVEAMRALWDGSGRAAIAWAYLALDSAVFVPVYIAFFVAAAQFLSNALADDDPEMTSGSERVLLIALAAPALALAAIDLVENAIGLARLGLVGAVLAAVASVTALGLLSRITALRQVLRTAALGIGAAAALIAVAGALGGVFSDACRAEAPGRWLWRLGCGAHQTKAWLVPLVLGLLLCAGAAWLFGVRLKPRPPGDPQCDTQDERRGARTRLRGAVWDVLVRSRYVLVALALVGALTVGMDQGRDVVYAVAASPFRDGGFGLGQRILFALGTAVAFVIYGTAVWLLVFTCWFWTRSVAQLRSVRSAGAVDTGTLRPECRFARHWARALAIVPVLLLVLLCAAAIRDAVMSQSAGGALWMGPVFVVLSFGLSTVVFGIVFLTRRSQTEDTCYYNFLDWKQWAHQAGFRPGPGHAKYRFCGVVSAYQLPLLLGLGMLLCRLFDAFPEELGWQQDYLPTMSFAIILFEVALWLCFFGWLSILEVHRSIPWVGLLIVAIGLLGIAGFTVNHVVWPAIEPNGGSRFGSLRMLGFTTLLAFVLLGFYHWAMSMVKRAAASTDAPSATPALAWRRADVWRPALLAVLAFGVLAGADHGATSRKPAAQAAAAWSRPTLDNALAAWLAALCNAKAPEPCKPVIPAGDDGSITVHFVSSEGGGIRAAVWTAFALGRFIESDPHFLQRTFSMSGVSGGAVGIAVLRACQREPARRSECLERFAGTDLLAPLLSAWMFEDALARVVPTSWCDTPGCGFLSRGAWFEQSMEAAAGGLRDGLIASRESAAKAGTHLPYLLLNATWVESGERAIASDLQINWRQFRGAKDQIGIIDHDLALGAAAHNAARFPFVNAIGALKARRQWCLTRLDEPHRPVQREQPAPAGAIETCGHLADGGYFDNSGAQSTLDVLQGLARCLAVGPNDADKDLYPDCRQLDAGQRRWLREHLVPQVLMIRNSVNPAAAREEVCQFDHDRPAPTGADVRPTANATCTTLTDKGYHPERPVCRPRADLFVDLVGPALAVLNVSGVGANGQLAEARQSQAVRALREIMGGAATASTLPPTSVLDLMPNGIRYPLGWHLSALAVKGMREQSATCVRQAGEQSASRTP